MTGNSYGAGNYGMNGRSYEPRFLFTYPNSKLAVMGSEQLAGVMEIIRSSSAKSLGRKINKEEERCSMGDLESQRARAIRPNGVYPPSSQLCSG